MKTKRSRIMAAAVILAVVLAGCVTVGGWFNDSNTNARVITKGIVAEFLAHNPAYVDSTISASTDVLTYLAGGDVAVDALEAEIMKRVQPTMARLTPDGRAMFTLLVGEVKAAIVRDLAANNVTDPDKVVLEIRTFVTWVNEAARDYKAYAVAAK